MTASAQQDFVGFDSASFGNVVLNKNQSAGDNDITLELSVGSYNNESITNYSTDSIFARIGLSVGRLDILTDKGIFPCTAFIVDEDHLLTNHHCVPGILDNERTGASRIEAVQFVAGYRQTGVEEGTKTYVVLPTPVESHKDLDYSLLRVMGNPSAEFGKLKLSDKEPKDRDPYWVIGHPMGEAQRISREKCGANSPAVSKKRLLHTCDTLPGNSGSPVIDASLQMVIGLHHAGSKKDSVNFAIPMREILDRSEVLEAALVGVGGGGGTRTDETPIDSAADPCDAIWNEAKAFNQCFGYEAYLQTCSAHAYAPFAQNYLQTQCKEAPVDTVEKPVEPPKVVETPKLRPWCADSGMSATETAICGSAYLANLDADLDAAYKGQSGRSTAAQQRAWLLSERDACGASVSCIGQAIINRITYLNTPNAPAPKPDNSGVRVIAGNYNLGSNNCYFMVASRQSISAATAFINQRFPGRSGIRMFQSNNGYYGVAVATLKRSEAAWRIQQRVSTGEVPSDSYCSGGANFVAEVLWNGGSSGGGGGGGTVEKTMWVNSSDGELNVRTGPGTNNSIITVVRTGSTVVVIGNSGKWSRIRIPDGRLGWVYTPLLSSTKVSAKRTCWANVVKLSPRSHGGNNSFLSMRTGPSTRNQKISETYLGDRLKVLARSNGWAKVQCWSGGCKNPNWGQANATGWSSQKYLSISCN